MSFHISAIFFTLSVHQISSNMYVCRPLTFNLSGYYYNQVTLLHVLSVALLPDLICSQHLNIIQKFSYVFVVFQM